MLERSAKKRSMQRSYDLDDPTRPVPVACTPPLQFSRCCCRQETFEDRHQRKETKHARKIKRKERNAKRRENKNETTTTSSSSSSFCDTQTTRKRCYETKPENDDMQVNSPPPNLRVHNELLELELITDPKKQRVERSASKNERKKKEKRKKGSPAAVPDRSGRVLDRRR